MTTAADLMMNELKAIRAENAEFKTKLDGATAAIASLTALVGQMKVSVETQATASPKKGGAGGAAKDYFGTPFQDMDARLAIFFIMSDPQHAHFAIVDKFLADATKYAGESGKGVVSAFTETAKTTPLGDGALESRRAQALNGFTKFKEQFKSTVTTLIGNPDTSENITHLNAAINTYFESKSKKKGPAKATSSGQKTNTPVDKATLSLVEQAESSFEFSSFSS